MTQYRKDPLAVSNVVDRALAGVGFRGSSFTNLDAVTHDKNSNRILIQELKRGSERLSYGQCLALEGLASKPGVDVWVVRVWGPVGSVNPDDFAFGVLAVPFDGDYNSADNCILLSADDYRARFRAWWEH